MITITFTLSGTEDINFENPMDAMAFMERLKALHSDHSASRKPLQSLKNTTIYPTASDEPALKKNTEDMLKPPRVYTKSRATLVEQLHEEWRKIVDEKIQNRECFFIIDICGDKTTRYPDAVSQFNKYLASRSDVTRYLKQKDGMRFRPSYYYVPTGVDVNTVHGIIVDTTAHERSRYTLWKKWNERVEKKIEAFETFTRADIMKDDKATGDMVTEYFQNLSNHPDIHAVKMGGNMYWYYVVRTENGVRKLSPGRVAPYPNPISGAPAKPIYKPYRPFDFSDGPADIIEEATGIPK